MRKLSLCALLLGALACAPAGAFASSHPAFEDMDRCIQLKQDAPNTWIHDFLVEKGESSEHAGVLQIVSDIAGSFRKAVSAAREMSDADYQDLGDLWFDFMRLEAEVKEMAELEAELEFYDSL